MEPAVEFKRVSTWAQDADLQEYALGRNRGTYDLDVRHVFRLKGKSAYGGEQQATLDQILCMVQSGEVRVVSVASLDRLERRGPLTFEQWMTAIVRAGGRVVSGRAGEEWVSDTSNMAVWLEQLAAEADRARRESEIKSERIRTVHRRLDEAGATRVRSKLGWRIVGPKYAKKQVEVPAVMAALREVAAKVAKTGRAQDGVEVLARYGIVRTADTIRNIIGDTAYVEALGDVVLRAQEALESHAKAKGRTRDTGSETYAGRIYCRHGNPLHTHQGAISKDGSRRMYYSVSAGSCGEPCGTYDLKATNRAVDDLLSTHETSVGCGTVGMSRKERRRYLERQAETGAFRVVMIKHGRNSKSVVAMPYSSGQSHTASGAGTASGVGSGDLRAAMAR